jgi:predicted nucleic acid-binding protein
VSERAFVDTNIWVYAIDGTDPAKQARAQAVLVPSAGSDFVVSTQVMAEFYVVATRKLATPLSEDHASAIVEQLARLPVVTTDAQLVTDAIAGSRAWGISLWDALIVRAAEVAGCGRILSEDLSDGALYGSVRVENPFAGPPPPPADARHSRE